MKTLLIGAGAVGQVYGRHLQQSGVQVGFYVKEKYADACRQGMRMYPLNRGRQAVMFDSYTVHTDLIETLEQTWDQVWLCVSTPALMGDWLEEVAEHLGDATLVALQPGVEAVERIESLFDPHAIVWGGISMISYQTPLKGVEDRPEGVAYWFPPMGPSPFWGAEAQARSAVAQLKKGGCPAAFNPQGRGQLIFGSALLMPHLVALEAAGWSFAEVRRGKGLTLAAHASREAMELLSARTGLKPPAFKAVIRPFWMGMLTRVAGYVVPLPIEPY
ncbi:MAG: 2-dehydropantoate 2-reductase N-terminal domain-containing protein, partial [Myxococcota bacterium]